MRLGRLTHAMVYEPDTVPARYVVRPNFHGGMKEETAIAKGYDGGREAKAEWEEQMRDSGATEVSAEMWLCARAMDLSIHADDVAHPLVTGGYAEQRVTWTDDQTGIECRGRVDHMNGRLSDLKTTRVIEPRQFASQAARLHYYAQIAWYYDGCLANGITFDEMPAILAVENTPPHDVLVLEFGSAELETGRRVYRTALEKLAWCRSMDEWPGVAGGVAHVAAPPAWYGGEEGEVAITMGGEEVF